MERSKTTFYREVQLLRQWWLWVIMLLITGASWWAFLAQIVGGEPWGDRPAPDWIVWLIFGLCGVFAPLLLYFARLVVTVEDDVVRIRWIPFARKTVPLTDIESFKPCTYRPIREYGGWGVRWGGKRGTAWNARGNRGVQLVLLNGKRILIGSQRAEELAMAIEEARGLAAEDAGPVGDRHPSV